MREDFSLSLDHHADRSVICCSGILDLLPAEHLRHAVRSAVQRSAPRVVVDCSCVSLLTSAGITALVDSAIVCKEAGVDLDLRFSSHVRRILDLVGLWWLGIIDDGVSIHTSLQRALRTYAALGSEATAAMLEIAAAGDTEDDLDGMTRGTDR